MKIKKLICAALLVGSVLWGQTNTEVKAQEEIEFTSVVSEEELELMLELPTEGVGAISSYSGFYNGGTYILYFDPATGQKVTGWKTIDGARYYFYPQTGAALSGVQSIDGVYYFFDELTYQQVVGPATASNSEKTYFYLEGGGITQGVVSWQGNTYYGEANRSGELAKGLSSAEGKLYYFDKEDGAAIKNQTIVFSNIELKANSSGAITSWKAVSGYENNIRVKLLLSALDKVGEPFSEDANLGWACGQFVRVLFKEQDQAISDAMEWNASYEQAKRIDEGTLGKKITESELRPGDTIYWSFSPCDHGESCTQHLGVHHVGIYIGNGKVVEASAARDEVVVQDIREYETAISSFKIVLRANLFSDEKYDAMNKQMSDGVEYEVLNLTGFEVTSLSATSLATNKVSLAWSQVSGADGYLIYGKKNDVYGYVGMTTKGVTYIDSKATIDWNYYWVYPYQTDATGTMRAGSCKSYKWAQGILPAVTYLRSSSQLNANHLTWLGVDGAEGYIVYATKPDGTYGYIGMTTQGSSYTDRTASKEGYTFYWVYAYSYDGSGKMVAGIKPTYTYGKAL